MKATTRARITSSLALLPFLGGVVTLSSACTASTEAAGADTEVEHVNESIATDPGPNCRNKKTLPAKACNKVVCDGFEYVYEPTGNATACTTASGAAGRCATDWQSGQCLQTITGTLTPKFYVVTVQYAPPGSASSVDYGTSSTSTTSTSTSDSFDNSVTLTAGGSLKADDGSGADISVSYSLAEGSTDKSLVEVKSTTTTDVTINGFGDGVDHGLDRIYLLLKPTLNVTTFGKDVSWSFASSNAPPIYVTPDWLLGRSPMPAWILTELQGAGITPAEYTDILSLDPYANANPKVDASRFVLQKKINYEPLTVAGSKPTQTVYSTADQTTITTSTETKTTNKVAVSVSASLFKVLSFKDEYSMTWTYDNVSSASTASQLSVKATIVQPSVGYTGGEIVDVYLDTIFNTFLFVVEPPPLVYHGPLDGPISVFGF